ncbi:MAG: hypothetical protein ACKON9_22620 [Planctomycetaceae bacterium]
MSGDSVQVASAARPIYEKLKSELLPEREYFRGLTLTAAIEQARSKYPQRLVHTFRLGHRAAIHFGMQTR